MVLNEDWELRTENRELANLTHDPVFPTLSRY
jgi:hypothetical protein